MAVATMSDHTPGVTDEFPGASDDLQREMELQDLRAAVDTLTRERDEALRALRLSVALGLPEGRDVDVAVAELLEFVRQMKEPAQ
jgi:hypothetical protein